MTAMPPLRDILNNTPADAINVDFNFNTIESHIGSELINRDGSVAMTGPLTLPGAPTAPNHAATKAYVDGNVIPIGTIWEFAGNIAPSGWAFCDGASKSTTDPAYAALFAVIGYRHGGAGANFNVPDRRARVAIGFSAGDAVAGTLGARGGNRDSTLPSHAHTQAAHGHAVTVNATDTNHLHDLQNHSHYVQHTHDSGVRRGYDVASAASGHGGTNAIYVTNPPGNGVSLGFITRETAVCQDTLPGSGNQQTRNATRDYTDGPNPNNTGWMDRNNPHGHSAYTDAPAPAINPAGASPTNTNYPLYEVVNFIIRIG
jgi:microcystin-dependent protein